MVQLNFDAATAQRRPRAYADEHRLQPARGGRAGELGRQQAPARGRHASGAPPGRRLARGLLHLGAVPRRLRLAGRRLRRHAGADVRRAPRGPDDSERRDRRARGRFPGSRSRGAGASCSPPSSTARPARTSRRSGREPFRWATGWRDRSVAVPAGGALGTSTTAFFCGAIAHGSNLLRRALDQPWAVLVVLVVLIGLVVIAAARATWRPAAPLRLARRRASGQILAATARMYFGHVGLFIGIGSILLPISLLDALLQAVILRASSVAGIEAPGRGRGRARAARRRARHGADAARRRDRHGGDHPGARRARRRAPGESRARVPPRARQRAADARRARRGRRDRHDAREHDRADPDRDRPRDPLGADRPRHGDRGPLRARARSRAAAAWSGVAGRRWPASPS